MRELHEWFYQNRRDFPWRVDPTPYRVWISEVMLQQTRASVVIPYFERWMELFPDVKTLAEAPLEKVIKAWEGLGYYSRARNLHRGAKEILERFQGHIPSSREDLQSIRGIGPYTVGAILSFGFKERAPAVDGNVTRVISRLYLIEENVSKQAVKKKITGVVEEILDEKMPWVSMEALIELGATVCTPKPRCESCPLQKQCLGKERAEFLPIKNGEKEIEILERTVVWIEAEGKVLVRKGEAGKIMADLYELPYFEKLSLEDTLKRLKKDFGFQPAFVKYLKKASHTFTRYKAYLYPIQFKTEKAEEIPGFQWVLKENLSELPFSSGHRRIVQE
jgi:A/G-specific adenine glycosylase